MIPCVFSFSPVTVFFELVYNLYGACAVKLVSFRSDPNFHILPESSRVAVDIFTAVQAGSLSHLRSLLSQNKNEVGVSREISCVSFCNVCFLGRFARRSEKIVLAISGSL